MLYEFLEANRAELIERCRVKVGRRSAPRALPGELTHGIPLFMGQLIETLRIEQGAAAKQVRKAGGPLGPASGGEASQFGNSATMHGYELLQHGYTIDQVVHDYGDLCQAVTELAMENDEPVSSDDFHTLNRCLDDAIADAVIGFGGQRDSEMSEKNDRVMSERLGLLAHELRNFLNTAMLSYAAIKVGGVGLNGATSAVLDRSHAGLRDLIDHALAEVRLAVGVPTELDAIDVPKFIAEVRVGATLAAQAKGCELAVSPVAPGVAIRGDRQMIYSALSNLLQNAFKFTQPGTRVLLRAGESEGRVLIEVEDQCGGIPEAKQKLLFVPFEQIGADRSGLGLGLSISRRAIEACGGTLRMFNVPGKGCVFTIDLPSHSRVASARKPVQDLSRVA